MEPVEPDRSSARRGRALLTLLGIGAAVVLFAMVVSKLRRSVVGEFADLSEEGVLALTDAIVDELFATG